MRHRHQSSRGRRRAHLLFAAAAAVAGIRSSARALVIVPTFDSTITSLPNALQVEAAINYADLQFEQLYSNPITVNITFFGTSSDAFAGESNPALKLVTYSSLQSAFVANAISTGDSDQLTAAENNWPASDPTGNGNDWFVPTAELKAMGLVSANNPTTDATITLSFTSSNAPTFDPYNRALAGTYDFIGAVEHEVAHSLGRVALLGLPDSANHPDYSVLDLYRFTAPSTLGLTTAANVYYSIDGGQTNLKTFSAISDASDWSSTYPTGKPGFSAYVPDSFNAISGLGYTNAITPVDVTTMDDLGYNINPILLTWNGGNSDFLAGSHWSSTALANVNPYHGVILLQNTGGTASHNFTSGENLTLSSDTDIGVSLQVQNGTFQIGVSGAVAGSGYGVLVNQDGSLIVGNTGVVNIAGGLSIGDEELVTNATASFSGSSTVNIGTVAGTTQIFYVGAKGVGSVTQSGSAAVNAPELDLGDFAGTLATPAGTGTYSLANSAKLTVSGNEIIGNNGLGTFLQSGGTNAASGNLLVGSGASGNGGYFLIANTATLTVSGEEIIGNDGFGNFQQTGGLNSDSGDLSLGSNGGSAGVYSLSGTGRLAVLSDEIIGDAGTGTFTLIGVTNAVTGSLYLGNSSNGSGAYTQSGSSKLSVSGDEIIGNAGSGTFMLNGGTNAVSGTLYLGKANSGNGNYFLTTSAKLSVAGDEVIGFNGTGIFNQAGGSNAVTGTLYLGDSGNGNGSYSLNNGATLTVTANEEIGYNGQGASFLNGGAQTVGGIIDIGRFAAGAGALNINGGTLNAGSVEVGSDGTGTLTQIGGILATSSLTVADHSGSTGSYSLSISGSLSVSTSEIIGNAGSGTFNQSGGVNTLGETAEFIIGGPAGGTGTYILSGSGILTAPGLGFEYIGNGGRGFFNQSGGTHTADDLDIGFDGSTGTYTLSGSGALSTSAESVGVGGRGTFNQSGGSNTAGIINLGENANSNGAYLLSGGTLTAGSIYVGGNLIFAGGKGDLTVSGSGLLNVSSTLVVYSASANSINFNGGTINTAALNVNGVPGNFNWTSGVLGLTSGVQFDPGATPTSTSAAFGSVLSLGLNKTLNVTGNEILGGTSAFTLMLGGDFTGGSPANNVSGNLTIDAGSTLSLLPIQSAVPSESVAGQEIIGNNATGSFVQMGGSNTMGTAGLELGVNSNALGIYSLTGASFPLENSFLTSAGSEIVGFSGTGVFNQSDGTNTFSGGILYLGYNSGSTGTYTLGGSSGYLDAKGSEYVGVTGAGVFIQTGGTNTINNFLYLGAFSGSTGSYTLSAGSLSGGILEHIGASGAGNFTQSGGTHTAATIYIGENSGSTGNYTLSGGVMTAFSVYAGGSSTSAGGTGVLTISRTGQLSVAGTLKAWNNGRVNLDVPSTSVGNLAIAGNGIVNLNGTLNINYGSPVNDPVSTIVGYLKNGYNAGAWNGTSGFISTSITGGTPTLSLGYADGNTDSGTAASPNQIVVKYTLAGDANLDGLVNFNDLVAVVQNFNKAGTDWAHGNFGYAASTNFLDLVAIVQNFNKTLPPPSGSAVESGGTTIPLVNGTDVQLPEPAAISLFAAGMAGLLGRRRRRKA